MSKVVGKIARSVNGVNVSVLFIRNKNSTSLLTTFPRAVFYRSSSSSSSSSSSIYETVYVYCNSATAARAAVVL